MDPSTLSAGISSLSALHLASSVRYRTSLPQTYLSGLETLLSSSSESDEHALRRGDVVELQSLPGAGKTSLLLFLAAIHLLPRKAYVRFADLDGGRSGGGVALVDVGGKEETVAWMECSTRRFPIERLAALLRTHLNEAIRRWRAPKGLGAPKEEEVDSLVEEALSRLHVFRCSSTLQLAVTVQNLPSWAAERAEREGGEDEPEVGLVVVEGMSEFAWPDQYTRETALASSTPSSAASAPTPPLRHLLSALAHLHRTLSPLIFLSQWVFRPSTLAAPPLSTRSDENLPFYAHHFAPPYWPSLTNPPYPFSSSSAGGGEKDPLDPPLAEFPASKQGGGAAAADDKNTKWPTFPLKLHITLHPPEKPVFPRGTTWAQVLHDRRGSGYAARERETSGIKCVVRVNGGKEVGSWEMSVGEGEVAT
ncbi:hypothetical protein JCM6882_001809 [Rhodosporidiobolus microsporus]